MTLRTLRKTAGTLAMVGNGRLAVNGTVHIARRGDRVWDLLTGS
jgi:hypothetical protein